MDAVRSRWLAMNASWFTSLQWSHCRHVMLLLSCVVVGRAQPGGANTPSALGYPDIASYTPDLEPPPMTIGEPAAGRRVRATLPAYHGSDVHYALYLPDDWKPGGKYPVIVEYAGNGNYRNKYGDVCTGRVEDCSLGYGLSGGRGCIWICMPYVDVKNRSNAIQWWGDVKATVAFCQETVRTVCADFGGDVSSVFICGFSRGALACNYIGLHDDAIAGLWRGFFAASHYDGVRQWPYPESDAKSAQIRLARLGQRPVFVSHEGHGLEPATYSILDTVNYLASTGRPLNNFRFQIVPFRNHTDRWVLYDIPVRKRLRAWFQEALAASPNRNDPVARE
jgi:hypothetical protein